VHLRITALQRTYARFRRLHVFLCGVTLTPTKVCCRLKVQLALHRARPRVGGLTVSTSAALIRMAMLDGMGSSWVGAARCGRLAAGRCVRRCIAAKLHRPARGGRDFQEVFVRSRASRLRPCLASRALPQSLDEPHLSHGLACAVPRVCLCISLTRGVQLLCTAGDMPSMSGEHASRLKLCWLMSHNSGVGNRPPDAPDIAALPVPQQNMPAIPSAVPDPAPEPSTGHDRAKVRSVGHQLWLCVVTKVAFTPARGVYHALRTIVSLRCCSMSHGAVPTFWAAHVAQRRQETVCPHSIRQPLMFEGCAARRRIQDVLWLSSPTLGAGVGLQHAAGLRAAAAQDTGPRQIEGTAKSSRCGLHIST